MSDLSDLIEEIIRERLRCQLCSRDDDRPCCEPWSDCNRLCRDPGIRDPRFFNRTVRRTGLIFGGGFARQRARR